MSTAPKIQPRVKLNVKLVPGVDRQRSKKLLSNTPGLCAVTQTFPEEADEDLSSLYILEIDPTNLKAALTQLRHNTQVEYVEETARRKLIG